MGRVGGGGERDTQTQLWGGGDGGVGMGWGTGLTELKEIQQCLITSPLQQRGNENKQKKIKQ